MHAVASSARTGPCTHTPQHRCHHHHRGNGSASWGGNWTTGVDHVSSSLEAERGPATRVGATVSTPRAWLHADLTPHDGAYPLPKLLRWNLSSSDLRPLTSYFECTMIRRRRRGMACRRFQPRRTLSHLGQLIDSHFIIYKQ